MWLLACFILASMAAAEAEPAGSQMVLRVDRRTGAHREHFDERE